MEGSWINDVLTGVNVVSKLACIPGLPKYLQAYLVFYNVQLLTFLQPTLFPSILRYQPYTAFIFCICLCTCILETL
jgi:hypothetical protein